MLLTPLVQIFTVKVPSTWLLSNFKATTDANKTITHWAICYSAQSGTTSSVKEAAGGRWRIGYWDPTSEGEAKTTSDKFFKNMNGTTSNNQKRTAGESWDGGANYPPNARMDGNIWTTLCPAPIRDNEKPCWPDTNPLGQNRYGWGCIIFDTYMNDTIAANTALTISSGGPIYDPEWGADTASGKFLLGFDFDKTTGNVTTVQAINDKCKNKDPDGGRELDGDRAAPSKDDRSWSY